MRMVTGADHEIGLRFNRVGLFAIESDLIAPLIEFPVSLCHRVIAAGGTMLHGVVIAVVLNGILRSRTRGRAAHACLAKAARYLAVAAAAHGRIHGLRR